MKEIIITGASGFIGSSLSKHLEAVGFKVLRLSLREKNWKSKISPEAYAIIHLAAISNDERKHSLSDYNSVNIELTKEVYDHFSQSDIKKFLFFSSVKAVTESVATGTLSETDMPRPSTDYGYSKRQAELHVLGNVAERKLVYVLRPCVVHGPDKKGSISLLFKFVMKGIPYPLGSFHNERSFLSITNLNFLVHQLCDKDIKSGIYNLSDSERISTVELVKIISRVLKKSPKIWKVNKKLVIFIAKVFGVLELPISTHTLNKLTGNYVVSNSKILQELQVELPLSLEQGIKQTITSFNK
ncbi:MAG: nucleoside-diphosphate-sugar epimerase [Glaciecola sp.]|jgi:nucleoside-diphosphate-sugar epimerase